MKKSLLNVFSSIFFSCLIFTCAHAEQESVFATPQQTQEFFDAVKNKGNEVLTTTGFYQAGIECHQRQLNGLTYYPQRHALLILTNDSLGNCQLTQVFTNAQRNQIITGFTCVVSDSEFKNIFAPWFLDALKTFDQTKQMSPMMQKFIMTVNQCMKKTNIETIFSIIQSSTPKKSTMTPQNVQP